MPLAVAPRRKLPTIDLTQRDRKSTRLNSSHVRISYAVFCLKKKKVPHLTRWSRSSRGQVIVERNDNGFGTAGSPQLGADASPVVLDRPRSDHRPPGELLVG